MTSKVETIIEDIIYNHCNLGKYTKFILLDILYTDCLFINNSEAYSYKRKDLYKVEIPNKLLEELAKTLLKYPLDVGYDNVLFNRLTVFKDFEKGTLTSSLDLDFDFYIRSNLKDILNKHFKYSKSLSNFIYSVKNLLVWTLTEKELLENSKCFISYVSDGSRKLKLHTSAAIALGSENLIPLCSISKTEITEAENVSDFILTKILSNYKDWEKNI